MWDIGDEFAGTDSAMASAGESTRSGWQRAGIWAGVSIPVEYGRRIARTRPLPGTPPAVCPGASPEAAGPRGPAPVR
jgi:hypothetical protein